MPRKSKENVTRIENINESNNKLLSKNYNEKDINVSDNSTTSKTNLTKKGAKSGASKSEKISKISKSSAKKSTKATDISASPTSKSNKSTKSIKTTKQQTKKTSTTRKKVDIDALKNKEISPVADILEYYDLPYKYNHTVIKLLAQTPKTLFVYWEVSDSDIENYKKEYGENFFYITKPVLLVHNLTLNKTFEVEVNDFANCWYITTQDTNCQFDIELCRRFIQTATNKITSEHKHINDYIYITKSNDLQSPNDHVLLENLNDVVTFKNVNTNEASFKNITSPNILNNIYTLYEKTYQEFYKKNNEFLKNPSSKSNF